ncbi:hypothetical protein [Streptomyces sp. NPDC101234]|uniref:hypothetical protein n=1 Tax=Streptomyces sp. NPDC101234 TaxID=3366138 RepID=UPI0037F411A0
MTDPRRRPRELSTWLDRTAGYAQACDTGAQSALLEHMKATDTAADVESIRATLGAGKLSIYAHSYGTCVAQVYASALATFEPSMSTGVPALAPQVRQGALNQVLPQVVEGARAAAPGCGATGGRSTRVPDLLTRFRTGSTEARSIGPA